MLAQKTEIPESATESGSLSLPLSDKENDSSRSGESAVSPSCKSVLEPPLQLEAINPCSGTFRAHLLLTNTRLTTVPRFSLSVRLDLPAGLATASALKEHFSSYGELAYLDLGASKDKEKTAQSEIVKSGEEEEEDDHLNLAVFPIGWLVRAMVEVVYSEVSIRDNTIDFFPVHCRAG